MSPLITVILPVYNRQETIANAIQSILDQTYPNFELIIVDDASTDNTLRVIRQFKDERIKIIENFSNIGVSGSRRCAFESSEGNYIALMDSDDISLPNRLEKQEKVFSANPEVVICGGWMQELNSKKVLKYKERHEDILIESLIRSPIANPTAMMRSNILHAISYNEELKYGEDYDFWSRAMWYGTVYNIQEPLVLYNVHADQLSMKYKKEQLKIDVDIRLDIFKAIAYSQDSFPDGTLKKIFLFEEYFKVEELILFLRWLKVLEKENSVQEIFSVEKFNNTLRKIREDVLLKIFFLRSDIGIDSRWRSQLLLTLNLKDTIKILSEKAAKFPKRLIK